MGGPHSGKYHIVRHTGRIPPPPPVGATHSGSTAIDVVQEQGLDNVWTLHKLENGNYHLALKETGTAWRSLIDGEVVAVSFLPEPPQAEWVIQERGNNTYSIDVPQGLFPTRAWTLDNLRPGAEVRIGIFELQPRPDQLWVFHRVNE